MDGTEHYHDILVVGGGPAGLLLAEKLGRQLKVCLLERSRIGQTPKFWLTTAERLARHDLLAAAQNSATRATLGTFKGSFAYAEGDFAVADEAALLRILMDRCVQASVCLIENTKVLNVTINGQRLLLETTNGVYQARLVIDASGGGSPFAATFRLHRLEGFYSIYGAHLKDLNLASGDIIGGHIIHFGHPAPILEVIPTGPTSAFCIVFVVSKDVIEPAKLSTSFLEHVDYNPFFKANTSVGANDLKMGVIPIGQPLLKTLPGILPVGEAGMLQSPLLGAAFNEVLEYANLIAQSVLSAFSRQNEGIVQARVKFPIVKVVNDYVQLALVRSLLDGSLASFDRLTSFIKGLGPIGAYRLFATQLGWPDAPSLLKAAPKLMHLGR
jgi:flavin-dependent dehydrogenase